MDITDPTSGERTRGFCFCGCGQRTKPAPATRRARGDVKGQPVKWILGHHTRTPNVPPCGYRVNPETGCWDWLLGLNASGYGMEWDGRIKRLAHIVEWERVNGPVPAGRDLDHLCRNRKCCNPEHVEPVTRAVNLQRGEKAILTPRAVRAIRVSGEGKHVLAARYGCSAQTIQAVRKRLTWKNIA